MADRKKLVEEEASEEASEPREVYLRDGRTLSIGEQAGNNLVEIRSASGMVEVRILLTEQGPVLQMESARLELRASEAVEIAAKRVEIKATDEVTVDAEGNVRVNGKMIFLN